VLNVNGTGNSSNNLIVGNVSNNVLKGGGGNDTLRGGLGDDTYYYVYGTTVQESAGEGTDTMITTDGSGAVIAAHVENFTVTGNSLRYATVVGNALDNIIIAREGDVIDGGGGNDTVIFRSGFGSPTAYDPSYEIDGSTAYVDSPDDRVVFLNADEGLDSRVISSIDRVLDDGVGTLELAQGSAARSGTGNHLDNLLHGNEFGNVLYGLDGNDTFYGGGGADTLLGGEGDDAYYLDPERTLFNATQGPTYFYQRPPMEGDAIIEAANEGVDTVYSVYDHTLSANVENLVLETFRINSGYGYYNQYALRGTGNALNNRLTGNAGDNVLDGDTGADTMIGGAGNDVYHVDDGGDVVVDTAGTDTIYSALAYSLSAELENLVLTGVGDDTGTGNSSNNLLDGSQSTGANQLVGGSGDDTYVLGLGDSVVEMTDDGNDTVVSSTSYTLAGNVERLILSGSAATTGTGSAGNDGLDGSQNAAANVLIGLDGDDTYYVDTLDAIVEAANGGHDIAVVMGASHTLADNVEDLVIAESAGSASGTGNARNNVLTGNSSDNRLDGAAGDDTLRGGAGNDTYVVDSLLDVIEDSQGYDTVETSGSHTLGSDLENLVLTGSAAVSGTGNALNNTLDGTQNTAANVLAGGLGDDYYMLGAGDTAIENADEGADWVQAAFSHTLGSNIEGITLVGTDAADATGNALDNHLVGNSANNVLDGGAGADTMHGMAGDDTYVVDDAGDRVFEGVDAGADQVHSSVSFTLSDHVETLVLTGTAAIDGSGSAMGNALFGNAMSNVLHGGEGDDTLDGGGGSDTLDGGVGSDTYVLRRGGGNDAILCTDFADAHVDTVRLEGLNPADVRLTEAGNDLLVTIIDTNETLTIKGFVASTYGNIDRLLFADGTMWNQTAMQGNVTVIGTEGDDYLSTRPFSGGKAYGLGGNDTLVGHWGGHLLSGGAGNDSLTAGGGSNVLDGGTGNDTLSSADGSDVLDGGAGDDYLYSGSGNDLLNGGSDADTLIGSDGDDTLDGGDGNDTLYGGWYVDSPSAASNDDSLFGGGGEDYLYGGIGNDAVAGGAGNDALVGSDGDDTLVGGVGDDSIYGDSGNDTYVFGRGDGNDSIHNVDPALGRTDRLKLEGINPGDIRVERVNGNDLIVVITDSGESIRVRNYFVDDASKIDLIEFAGGVTWNRATMTSNLAVTGTAGDDILIAPDNSDSRLYGLAGNDTLTGNGGNDLLDGGEGSDSLDGGTGNDTMLGGAGNDTYVIDSSGDVIVENADEGTDLVQSSLSHALATDLENLALIGADAINGTGNSRDNSLTGNSADNVLDGGSGVDTFAGGAGNDTYIVDDAGEVVWENPGEGTDLVRSSATHTLADDVENLILTGASAINGTGNALNNTLTGNGGNNILNGSTGNDTMAGGTGDDTYVVDSAGDVVIEAASGGSDLVQSRVTWTLASEIENLTLTGTSAINGTGNTLDNVLTGNSANNTLSGGAGADSLIGGAGNDTYVVDNVGDVVTENAGAGTDTVQSSLNHGLGANVENLTLTGTSAINGSGNALNNTLTGNGGNNILDGGAGNDTLIGGAGDDIYLVDSASDVVTEAASAGIDLVQSGVTLTLASNVENLTLTGSAAINGTGNTLANVLTGNSASNTLSGGTGNDTMVGGGGNDTYVVDAAGDVVVENVGEGTDLVQSSVTYTLAANIENLTLTGTSAINGTGNDLANLLTGNSGNNTLNGGAGADTLVGGAGNDTYVVDDAGDVITEGSNAGTDLVQSSVTYSLATNVENLTLTGTANINGTGNTLANTLTGNSGNNVLDGGTGADTLIGGAGNDTYIVDNTADVVTEGSGAGSDLVQSSVTCTLAANVENLTLTGTSAINGTGNSLANTLTGNSGNNVLDGGTGADTLIGGAGNDTYVVDNTGDVVTENAAEGTDLVQSSVTYTLAANLENLSLTGTANINGTGNDLANVLTGNTGANRLTGGAGNDTYVVDNAGDVVIEVAGEGTDLVQSSITHTLAANVENVTLTGTSAIDGTGNDLANTLTGNSADNILNGGAGADTLVGGAGNDTYYVSTGDTVTEGSGAGTDTVITDVTWTLGSNLENLTLAGAAAINGTGNTLANLIIGNGANNTLSGGSGADTMQGGAGDDTYVVDDAADAVSETAAAGTDLVQSSVTHTLAANVENLTLTGSTAINGTGNELANVLTGNSGANTLIGGAGNDSLNGGSGADTLLGGLEDDVYTVDHASDVVTENAGEGIDLVNSSITLTLAANVEALVLTGSSALNGTGHDLANLLRGNTGNNVLNGAAGDDILEGGDGNDTLTDTAGTALFNGGAGTDTINGGAAAEIFRGGLGNDTYSTAGGDDILLFNKGDGQDTFATGGTGGDTLSLGGDLAYADLSFSKSSNDLVLKTGGTDQITFKDWYAAAPSTPVLKLQVIAEAMAGFAQGGSDPLKDQKIESFNFSGLVGAFDAARAANPGLTTWALTNALATFQLAGSDSAAIGGDLAYQYGKNGTLAGIGLTSAQQVIGDAGFGAQAQTLRPLAAIQEGSVRLS